MDHLSGKGSVVWVRRKIGVSLAPDAAAEVGWVGMGLGDGEGVSSLTKSLHPKC